MELLAFTCSHCGRQTERAYRGTGPRPSLCGNTCKVSAYRARHPDRYRQRQIADRAKEATALSLEIGVLRRWARRDRSRGFGFLAAIQRVRERILSRSARGGVPCSTCGEAVGYSFGRPRRYCSDHCQGASEVGRRNKRAAKAAREARRRNVFAEVFDPIEVLERDRWRCHICDRHTPRVLRGTCDPRAPELDHIVPLALGGAHTRANTACSCRRCNSAKGARAIGQPRLL